MRMNPVLRRLHIEEKRFVTSLELKGYCRAEGIGYDNVIRYLTSSKNLLRIFKGIFYVRSFDEIKLGITRISHLELVAKGLELKGVTNWYFGLQTALKFNNATHEEYRVETIINDTILRTTPIVISGHAVRFVKLKKKLCTFGVISKPFPHSDLEKTILDMIYLGRYRGLPGEKILLDVEEYAGAASLKKLRRYAAHYPGSVARLAGELK